jgi:AcrR family transcriptional regulator
LIFLEKMIMTSGKRGRPLEDKLARQREIYTAVSPLILQIGARELAMRQAARTASLSIGGLYYYFPTKRALLLHGLSPLALYRLCQAFHAEYSHLAYVDPRRYIEAGIKVVVQ